MIYVIILGTRETAYINAITSAALVQSIAKACRKSLKECGCRSRQAQLLQKPDDLDQVYYYHFILIIITTEIVEI